MGLLGLVLLATTLGVIATDWEDLSGTREFEVTVTSASHDYRPPSGDLGSGASRTFTVRVDEANVHHVVARLEWRESSPTGSQHLVTMTLRDPTGGLVGQASGQGGVAGITIDRTLREVPPGGRFTALPGNEETTFDERYPFHDGSIGEWGFTVQANTPTAPAGASLRYTPTLRIESYQATLAEAAPASIR